MSQPITLSQNQLPWYRMLNRYHWFVFIVCTLGWTFDCLDQQLFNANRKPAMIELLATDPSDPRVDAWATYSTSFLLLGWATGGIFFGILGDRIGRAKTMVFTILSYSVFTGLTAFAVSVYDFILYRFLSGLGVGGQFAVGVSLVAEALPDKARPPALGMLQAFSAFGNITAALIVMLFEHLAAVGVIAGSAWRWVFAVGILPALLAVVVMLRLEEPERWKQAVASGEAKKKAGSIRELFGDPRWRRNTICGMLLAASGVIGLWAIGVFSNDLTHTVFLRAAEEQARRQGEAEKD
ncbi:MAG: MFS transporter, partial [Thermoguttaceae bacterium]|nr:MFS transporter [Thermoguttaceae bacterium]